MSVEANKAVVRRFLDEIWNGKSLTTFDELVDPRFVNHDPSNPEARDSAGLKQFATMIATSFPDAHIDIDRQVGEGELVAKCWTFRGTQRGQFLDITPTGKQVEFTGTTTYRIVDGKIVELWWNWDLMGLLRQLGAVPEMAAAGAR